jgi:hypothetical protein
LLLNIEKLSITISIQAKNIYFIKIQLIYIIYNYIALEYTTQWMINQNKQIRVNYNINISQILIMYTHKMLVIYSIRSKKQYIKNINKAMINYPKDKNKSD